MFYMQFEQFIRSFSPHCIFVIDETMVDAAKGAKCITPRGGSPMSVDFEHLPHVSAMCPNNFTDTIVPPFMILPHHVSAMHEFDDIVAANCLDLQDAKCLPDAQVFPYLDSLFL
jgi:hypothetical protein